MTIGVLLMAYGTPASLDEVEAYYTHIRRGRAPTADEVADLTRRYTAIGGTSPLLERTQAQAAALQRELGGEYQVELGMKHAAPFIEDAVASLRSAGVERGVGLVLAPHYSAMSVGEYTERASAGDVRFTFIESWHLEPAFVGLLADRVLAVSQPGTVTVFTAHSLPRRIREAGDPYPLQVEETATAAAAAAGLDRAAWQVAWQSAGKTGEPWLGPDILDVVKACAADGIRRVAVCPCGFVSDHLEVLYDIDVQARELAERSGVELVRTESLNDDPRFISMLAELVQHASAKI